MRHAINSVALTASVIFTLVVSFSSYADKPEPTVIDCSVDDVQITTVQLLTDGDPVDVDVPNLPISASSCLAVDNVNNSFFNASFTKHTANLGYDEDGWLNQGALNDWWLGPGAFIDDADLLDLDGDEQVDDPGWILVGKDEGEGDGYVGQTSQNSESEYTFEHDLISFTNGGIGTRSGDWQYTPPKKNPEELIDLLGGDFFDQVAVVFKAGSGFAMYNFTIADLNLDPVLAGDFNFAFSGTWNIDDTLGADLSNMAFWARDPVGATEVPEPSTLVLLLISSLLLLRRKVLNR